MIKKASGGATLCGSGRDTEEVEFAVSFNKQTLRWTILGEAADVHRSDERSRVLKALEEAGEPLTTTEIISLANIGSRNTADVLLRRMFRDGQIERLKRGLYGLPGARNRVVSQICQKVRSGHKPLIDQGDNNQSDNLTDLTADAAGVRLVPGDDEPLANFEYPDLPAFLDRSARQ